MPNSDTGATPGAGATPAQSDQSVWVIGHRRDGSPIHAIAGGDETATNPAATPPAGQPNQQQPAPQQPPAQQPPATGESELGEAGKAAIQREREARQAAERELKELRPKVEAFTKAERERADAEKTAFDKAQERIAELERLDSERTETLQSERLRHRVEAGAAKRHFVDPEAAYALLDRSKVEFDDQGQPKNVDKLLDEMAKERPWMTGNSSGWDGAEGGSGVRQSGSLEEAAARRLEKQRG